MKTDKFIARYEENGIKKSVFFPRAKFTKKSASKYLNDKGVQNFFFFFEPAPPVKIGDNGIIFSGDIGFDITIENLLPEVESGRDIFIDSFGGNLWDGLKMHDAIKALGTNPRIEALGTVASSATLILLASENRYMSDNSRLLIHNPWVDVAGDDTELRIKANELETQKNNLANLYSKVSGKTTEEMLALMKEDRLMYLNEALDLNFVKTKDIKKTEEPKKENSQTKIDSDMTNDEKNEFGTLKNLVSNLKNLISPPKNVIIQDVNGVEIDFGDLETSDQIAVGSTATIDGSPASGEYVLEDGTTYVFEAGSLTEIKEDEADGDMEALKQENEDLKAENENLKTESQNLVTEKESLQAKFTADLEVVTNKLDEFQSKFSDDKPEPNTPPKKEETKSKFTYKK